MKKRAFTSLSVLTLALAGCTSYTHHHPVTESHYASTSETVAQSGSHISADGRTRTTTVFVTDEPRNSAEYRSSIAGPGLLGLVSSQLAQTKATHPDVKMFANTEVAEQQGISRSLKDMNTTIPLLNAEQKAVMNKLKSAKAGSEFDELYMEAQIKNHKKLLMITDNYLDHSGRTSDVAGQVEGRNLAGMSLPVIKQHLNAAMKIEEMVD